MSRDHLPLSVVHISISVTEDEWYAKQCVSDAVQFSVSARGHLSATNGLLNKAF
jgi:hypothetical protein